MNDDHQAFLALLNEGDRTLLARWGLDLRDPRDVERARPLVAVRRLQLAINWYVNDDLIIDGREGPRTASALLTAIRAGWRPKNQLERTGALHCASWIPFEEMIAIVLTPFARPS